MKVTKRRAGCGQSINSGGLNFSTESADICIAKIVGDDKQDVGCYLLTACLR